MINVELFNKSTTDQCVIWIQILQEFINTHKEAAPSMYGRNETGLSSYSHLGDNSYPPSSYQSHQSLGGGGGGYGSSGLGGGYSSYRY